ncbi:MAG: DNA polymerase III subunit delta [Desulfamplus sp.]|nr:DNA polymerase III subunit delta [Desulfamplus sp.]
MAEIKHNILNDYLNSLREKTHSTSENVPQLFFIWGEEFICRKVFDAVISFLLPSNLRELGYELLEGEEASIPVIIERICTYSFFQERRVIAIKNAPLFNAPGTSPSQGFLNHDLENLKNLIERGFPENHYLVITSPNADKRRNLFNTIKTSGIAIDCSVAQGSGKTDKEEQTQLLRLTMKMVLDRAGKGIEGDAFQALVEMTGFDPATFNDNLERLTAFIGNKDTITINDVYSAVKRSRKDPIFELTNAVAQKNLESSIFYYKSLCDNGFHPLQLLAAIVNQIRRIFVVKIFIETQVQKGNSCWRQGNQNYQNFTANTMPFITKADEELNKIIAQWGEELRNRDAQDKLENNLDDSYESESDDEELNAKPIKASKRKKKGEPDKKNGANKGKTTDLIIAPNLKNAYPIFQTFLRADKFELNELSSIMVELSEMDYKFKSSSDGDPFIILEEMIIRICTNNFQKYNLTSYK